MNAILKMKIGEQKDIRLGFVTRDVFRISENKFEITCTVGTWITAVTDKATLLKIIKGKESILNLNWK